MSCHQTAMEPASAHRDTSTNPASTCGYTGKAVSVHAAPCLEQPVIRPLDPRPAVAIERHAHQQLLSGHAGGLIVGDVLLRCCSNDADRPNPRTGEPEILSSCSTARCSRSSSRPPHPPAVRIAAKSVPGSMCGECPTAIDSRSPGRTASICRRNSSSSARKFAASSPCGYSQSMIEPVEDAGLLNACRKLSAEKSVDARCHKRPAILRLRIFSKARRIALKRNQNLQVRITLLQLLELMKVAAKWRRRIVPLPLTLFSAV